VPTPIPPALRIGTAEPRDAVAAWQARGLLQPSFRWQDVWQDEHARATAVAGVQRLDVLQAVRDELDAVVAEGRSLADFAKRLRPALAAKGYWGDVEVQDPETGETRITRFDNRRLQLIYDVNLRQSHAAGRWARIERTKRSKPFVMYRTMRDERVRTSHAAWDGTVLPVDHPWWNTHYPPCGWRCRCHAFSLSERELARRRAKGQRIRLEPPPMDVTTWVNPSTGEVVPVPAGIDPGFAYNPGKARDAALHDQLLRKALKATPVAGAVAVAQAQLAHTAMTAQAADEFGQWVRQVLQAGQPTGALRMVGALQPGAVRALASRGMAPPSAAVAVRDVDVLHALRTADAAPADVYRLLPELLPGATALLRPTANAQGLPEQLLLVVDLVRQVGADGRTSKAVLVVQQMARRPGASAQLQVVRTVQMVDAEALRDSGRYELVWGKV
jgi:SPP1 gp7 family putative phage head morphogenesis protein